MITFQVLESGRRRLGISAILHAKDDAFRVIWCRLPSEVRWRLVAEVLGDLDRITLAAVVREVNRGAS